MRLRGGLARADDASEDSRECRVASYDYRYDLRVTAEGYKAGVIEGLDPDESWVEKTVASRRSREWGRSNEHNNSRPDSGPASPDDNNRRPAAHQLLTRPRQAGTIGPSAGGA